MWTSYSEIKEAMDRAVKGLDVQKFYLDSCSKESVKYRKRYEKKEFNYENDSWGSAEITQCSMLKVYEAYTEYTEYKSYEW